MEEVLKTYFVDTGAGLAMIGAMMAMMLGGAGSARGIRIAAAQGAGALSEKPDLFGKLVVFMIMPGTQGIYGFVCFFMICYQSGIMSAEKFMKVTPIQGLGLLVVGVATGIVLWRSAIYQGEASAAATNLTAKRPESFGRAIMMPALVETYAAVALLSAILLIGWIVAV